MEIPSKELKKFRAADHEQCAVIIQNRDGSFSRLVEVFNIDSDPVNNYSISVKEVLVVQSGLANGESIFGYLHTHLAHHDPFPSDRDFDGVPITMTNAVFHPASETLTWYENLTEVI